MDNTKTDLLQTIKDQVSNEKWPANFDDLHIKYREELWPEVCKRYAFEVAKASLNTAGERMPSGILCDRVKEESNIILR